MAAGPVGLGSRSMTRLRSSEEVDESIRVAERDESESNTGGNGGGAESADLDRMVQNQWSLGRMVQKQWKLSKMADRRTRFGEQRLRVTAEREQKRERPGRQSAIRGGRKAKNRPGSSTPRASRAKDAAASSGDGHATRGRPFSLRAAMRNSFESNSRPSGGKN